MQVINNTNVGSSAENNGDMNELIRWDYTEVVTSTESSVSEEHKSTGEFQVKSKFNLDTRGHLSIGVEDLLLLPTDMPKNVENLLQSIQRSIPLDSFDPNDISVEHLYIGPEIRICRIGGEKFQDVINIYKRETPLVLNIMS